MKYVFIVNPISGNPSSPEPHQKAISLVFQNQDVKVIHSQRRGHTRELARQHAGAQTTIVAVGGDGTVNEAASGVLDAAKPASLGIIPKGSGNGLAFEFGMSKNPLQACRQLLEGKILEIDAGRCNERYFFNMAGIGLDAETAWAFDQHGWRGRWPYYYLTARTLLTLNMPRVKLTTDRQTSSFKPLLIAVANGKQFGDGAQIAPQACINDGLFHLTIVESGISVVKIALAVPRLFNGTINQDPVVQSEVSSALTIDMPQPLPYHLDGEPFKDLTKLQFKLIKKALRVLLPQGYKP
ncbi:MAG: diacylglycerol kinase family lipid kinase [Elusimicrobia bacterium]|nr:diacylglycerol kinase family lipid kinase [Elusimicrobiota bacterium]